ncbi:hypothetical protein [Streptomyces parvus]|uniref:hypothetical protein n=1 Tax=Streptomyces parvus TaxID=66428 RepID=UPI0035DD0AB9
MVRSLREGDRDDSVAEAAAPRTLGAAGPGSDRTAGGREPLWLKWARVSEVLADSARLGEFSAVFTTAARKEGPPTHLHFHVARIFQGAVGIPETGGMYRVTIEDVSAWTMGDFSYSDH